jgi:hypothetical protein
MKPTPENLLVLKSMGFEPEEVSDPGGWWILKKHNWSFLMDGVPSIKVLVDKLVKTNYNYGYDAGASGSKRQFKPNDH